MLFKRIISTVAVLGVMAAFAVAGSPVFAAGKQPAEVTVYGNYNNNSAPAEDKFIPGPDPVEGFAEGFYFAGKGLADGARELGDGIGESGGKVADDAVAYGPPGLVSGTFKGVGRIGEGAVRGVGAVGHGAVKGTGCIFTFGAGC